MGEGETEKGLVQKDPLDRASMAFAGNMADGWRKFKEGFGEDERYWRLLGKEALQQADDKLSILIAECKEELIKYPSPKGHDSPANDWLNALKRAEKQITYLMGGKTLIVREYN